MDSIPLTSASGAPPAPDWEVARWFGSPTSVENLAGKVIVLHAFQMLCPGCVLHAIPQAASIHRAFDAVDVAVVGLHSVFEHHEAMTPTSLAAFLHEFRVPFPAAVATLSGCTAPGRQPPSAGRPDGRENRMHRDGACSTCQLSLPVSSAARV